jgi:hypothetical protein
VTTSSGKIEDVSTYNFASIFRDFFEFKNVRKLCARKIFKFVHLIFSLKKESKMLVETAGKIPEDGIGICGRNIRNFS